MAPVMMSAQLGIGGCGYRQYRCDTDADCVAGGYCDPDHGVCLPFPRSNTGPEHAPRIVELVADPSWVMTPATVSLQLTVEEPDGDAVELAWSQKMGAPTSIELGEPTRSGDRLEQTATVELAGDAPSSVYAFAVVVRDRPPHTPEAQSTEAVVEVTAINQSGVVLYVDGQYTGRDETGDMETPYKSIGEALGSSRLDGRSDAAIVIAGGDVEQPMIYEETVSLDGLSSGVRSLLIAGGYCRSEDSTAWSWDPENCPAEIFPDRIPESADGVYTIVDLNADDPETRVVFTGVNITALADQCPLELGGADGATVILRAADALRGSHRIERSRIVVSGYGGPRLYAVTGVALDCADSVSDLDVSLEQLTTRNRYGIRHFAAQPAGGVAASSITVGNGDQQVLHSAWGLALHPGDVGRDVISCSDAAAAEGQYHISHNAIEAGDEASGGGVFLAQAPSVIVDGNSIHGPRLRGNAGMSVGLFCYDPRGDVVIRDNRNIQGGLAACSIGLAVIPDGASLTVDGLGRCVLDRASMSGVTESFITVRDNTIWGWYHKEAPEKEATTSAGVASLYPQILFERNDLDGGNAETVTGLSLLEPGILRNNIVYAGKGSTTSALTLGTPRAYALGEMLPLTVDNNYLHAGNADILATSISLGETGGSPGSVLEYPFGSLYNNIIDMGRSNRYRRGVVEQRFVPTDFSNNLFILDGSSTGYGDEDNVLYLMDNRDQRCDSGGGSYRVLQPDDDCLTDVFSLDCRDGIGRCVYSSPSAAVQVPGREGDYHLTAQSPAIDRGSWLGAPCDKDRVFRTCRRPDIGPYEFIHWDCQSLSCHP